MRTRLLGALSLSLCTAAIAACGTTLAPGIGGEPGPDGSSNENNASGSNVDGGSLDASGSNVDGASDDAASSSSEVVLFGGYAAGSLGDTWTWDGNAWTQRNVTGPSARRGSAIASANGKVVLFGGYDGSPLADTWEWDGSAWTEKSTTGPSARYGAAMVAIDGKAILFGGTSDGTNNDADTWQWDGATWTEVATTGPGARYRPAASALGGKMILFGGTDSYDYDDTWAWDGTWSLVTNNAHPSARQGAVAAPVNGKVILYGGIDSLGTPLGDTWQFDGATWSSVASSGPMPRAYAAGAALNGSLVLFGGIGDGGPSSTLDDTWQWTTNWTNLPTSTAPPARDLAAIAGPEGPDNMNKPAGVVTLASGQSTPKGIAVTQTNIYWTNVGDGTVMTLPKAGGASPTKFASGQGGPQFIAAGGPAASPTLYWTNNDGTVMSQAEGSTTAVLVSTGGKSPSGIAATPSGKVAFTDFGASTVSWVDTTLLPLSVKTVATAQSAALFVAFDSAENYVWSDYGSGIVMTSQGPKQLSSNGAFGITTDLQNAYYTIATGDTVKNNTSSVMKVALTGATAPVQLVTGLGYPDAITLDNGNLYFLDATAGSVTRYNLTTAATTTLATGGAYYSLAVDSTNVYYVDGQGNVKRVAK